jgi:hypothetical protein
VAEMNACFDEFFEDFDGHDGVGAVVRTG